MPGFNSFLRVSIAVAGISFACGYNIGHLELRIGVISFLCACTAVAIALTFRYCRTSILRRLEECGIFHSVPMACILSMAIYAIALELGDPGAAWYARCFALGFILHLTIDEIYSYQEDTQRTISKFWSNRNKTGYLSLYLGALICWIWTV